MPPKSGSKNDPSPPTSTPANTSNNSNTHTSQNIAYNPFHKLYPPFYQQPNTPENGPHYSPFGLKTSKVVITIPELSSGRLVPYLVDLEITTKTPLPCPAALCRKKFHAGSLLAAHLRNDHHYHIQPYIAPNPNINSADFSAQHGGMQQGNDPGLLQGGGVGNGIAGGGQGRVPGGYSKPYVNGPPPFIGSEQKTANDPIRFHGSLSYSAPQNQNPVLSNQNPAYFDPSSGYHQYMPPHPGPMWDYPVTQPMVYPELLAPNPYTIQSPNDFQPLADPTTNHLAQTQTKPADTRMSKAPGQLQKQTNVSETGFENPINVSSGLPDKVVDSAVDQSDESSPCDTAPDTEIGAVKTGKSRRNSVALVRPRKRSKADTGAEGEATANTDQNKPERASRKKTPQEIEQALTIRKLKILVDHQKAPFADFENDELLGKLANFDRKFRNLPVQVVLTSAQWNALEEVRSIQKKEREENGEVFESEPDNKSIKRRARKRKADSIGAEGKVVEPKKAAGSAAAVAESGTGVEVQEEAAPVRAKPKWVERCRCDLCDADLRGLTRYYCRTCEVCTDDVWNSYDLCLQCYQCRFEETHHSHPRESFSTQKVSGKARGSDPLGRAERLDPNLSAVPIPNANTTRCILCRGPYQDTTLRVSHEEDGDLSDPDLESDGTSSEEETENDIRAGQFVSVHPFVYVRGEKKQRKHYWIHQACAEFSPEVVLGDDGRWYRLTDAVLRGRRLRCANKECRQSGATIGCFEKSCSSSFHLACTGKPLSFFRDGHIFYCQSCERNSYENQTEFFSCDNCNIRIRKNQKSYMCNMCETYTYPFHSFDICNKCFHNTDAADKHKHGRGVFTARVHAPAPKPQAQQPSKGGSPIKNHPKGSTCGFCGAKNCKEWREGFGGILLCKGCYEQTNRSAPGNAGDIDDYAYGRYFTRHLCADTSQDHVQNRLLDTYGPCSTAISQMDLHVSLMDVPGRAKRWATHKHASREYEGTWLPHIPRWALLRFSSPGDRVLTNFLGRGTDVIECMLLGRQSVGVDVNCLAVALAQKNTAFAVPVDLQPYITASCRPVLVLGDARKLPEGELFQDQSFDLVLSHPPYFQAIVYSDLDNDLSRISDPSAFFAQLGEVAKEAFRVLKPGGHTVLCLGDTRANCMAMPLLYPVLRYYLHAGFEVVEMVLKTQRNCKVTMEKGRMLYALYGMLMMTHEYIVVLRRPNTSSGTVTTAIKTKPPTTQPPGQSPSRLDEASTNEMTDQPSIGIPPDMCSYGQLAASGQQPLGFTRRLCQLVAPPNGHSNPPCDGTVWELEGEPLSFECFRKMVYRLANNEVDYIEQIVWDLPEEPSAILQGSIEPTCVPFAPSVVSTDHADSDGEDYERRRQVNIARNQAMLKSLGIARKEFGETVEGFEGVFTVTGQSAPSESPTLIFVPHTAATDPATVASIRKATIEIANEAAGRLQGGSYMVVGTKDYRQEDGTVSSMGMVLWEDLQQAGLMSLFDLKEIIHVAPGPEKRAELSNQAIQSRMRSSNTKDSIGESTPIKQRKQSTSTTNGSPTRKPDPPSTPKTSNAAAANQNNATPTKNGNMGSDWTDEVGVGGPLTRTQQKRLKDLFKTVEEQEDHLRGLANWQWSQEPSSNHKDPLPIIHATYYLLRRKMTRN